MRCERQSTKCRADYAAQEARAYGFSVSGNAAEQEVINAACEPDGYFCRLFSPANLPTWLLVFVGAGGVWAALITLRVIQRQADITEEQLIVAFRAYLGIIEPGEPLAEGVKHYATFPIINSGRVPARITSVSTEVIIQDIQGRELYRRSCEKKADGEQIPPEKFFSHALHVYWPSTTNAESVVISIDVSYKPGFEKAREDIFRFGRVFSYRQRKWTTLYTTTDVDLTQQNNA